MEFLMLAPPVPGSPVQGPWAWHFTMLLSCAMIMPTPLLDIYTTQKEGNHDRRASYHAQRD